MLLGLVSRIHSNPLGSYICDLIRLRGGAREDRRQANKVFRDGIGLRAAVLPYTTDVKGKGPMTTGNGMSRDAHVHRGSRLRLSSV